MCYDPARDTHVCPYSCGCHRTGTAEQHPVRARGKSVCHRRLRGALRPLRSRRGPVLLDPGRPRAPVQQPATCSFGGILMSRIIEIVVSPKGEATVRTKGYAGGDCLQASKWLENA